MTLVFLDEEKKEIVRITASGAPSVGEEVKLHGKYYAVKRVVTEFFGKNDAHIAEVTVG
jgi:hypothetical protein